MKPVMPAHDRQTPQRPASTSWWQRVHGAIRMLCFLIVGVIAVGVAANAAPSQSESPAPQASASHVGSLVATNEDVYALAEDGSAVYRATGQDSWVQVKSDGAQRIYGGGAGLFAVLPGQGDIARYQGGRWQPIGGPGAEFAVTNDALYGLSPDRTSVHKWTEATGWVTIDGSFEHLYGGGAGIFATAPGSGDVSRYADGTWHGLGGPGAEFAVTNDALYRLNTDRTEVEEWTPENGWRHAGDPAQHIYGGGKTLLATTPGRGDVAAFSSDDRTWSGAGGPGATFISSRTGIIYGVWPDRSGVSRRGALGAWLPLADLAPGSLLPVAQNIERLHELTELDQGDKRTTGTWVRLAYSHEKGEPDPYKFRWEANGCNVIGDSLGQFGMHFKSACDRHDFGYQNYRDALGEEGFRNGVLGVTGIGTDSPKSRVDAVFRQDLQRACANGPERTGIYSPPKPPGYDLECQWAIDKIWAAVVVGG
ncbi:phospholipase A2 [Streptomyces sp. NPDC089915]|uniref:phospholipase A2 n=1 Tax=Streptomyces sp. NPDC089915 TaxID=3155186 RepID=UPI00344AC244